jgi:pyruvate,orthophosphate dikinase
MATLSDAAWMRLHEMRLRGVYTGPEDPVTAELVDAGYALVRGTDKVITPAGREVHAAWARLPEGSEEEEVARRAYDQFLTLDRSVKQLTAEWQLGAANARPEGFNAEEWKLIDRLISVNEKAGGFLRRLGAAVPRFAGYRPRFSHALAQLEEGNRTWFSGLTVDSYHTAWWHLHEDLLLAIGVSRADDPNQ